MGVWFENYYGGGKQGPSGIMPLSGFHNKHIPEIKGEETFKGEILFNSEAKSPDIFKEKMLLFLGLERAWEMLNRTD